MKAAGINALVSIGGTATFYARRAVVLYEAEQGMRSYATVHEIDQRAKGPATLGVGRPVDRAFLRALSDSLQTAIPVEVLPPFVLCRTPDVIAWWSPAAARPMFFREGSALWKVNGRVFPHPALVWRLDGRQLYVRALAEDVRPDADAPVFHAPYWNTDGDGRVCLGDMRRPSRLTVDTLREWETGYFGSLFTGQNGAGDRTTMKGGIPALWRKLAGKPAFPAASLAPAEKRLVDFLKGGDRGRA